LDPTKWYPSNGGWFYHVVSTASEWICAATFAIFMLTLVPEFKNLNIDNPQVYVTIETFSEYSPNSMNGHYSSSVESIVSPDSYTSSSLLRSEQQGAPSDLAAEVAQIISEGNVVHS